MRNKLLQKFGPFDLIHAEQMFLYYLTSEKKKLIEENSSPTCRAGPLARVHMENFHLT